MEEAKPPLYVEMGEANTLRIQRDKVVVRAEIPAQLKTSVLQKLKHDVRYASLTHLIKCLLYEYVEQEG